MKFLALIVFASASPCFASDESKKLEGPQAEDGSRQVNFVAYTSATFIDLQACAIRKLTPLGDIVTVPLQDGLAVDIVDSTLIGVKGAAARTFEFHELGSQRSITLRYRHPFSAKNMVKLFDERIAKFCLPEFKAASPE